METQLMLIGFLSAAMLLRRARVHASNEPSASFQRFSPRANSVHFQEVQNGGSNRKKGESLKGMNSQDIEPFPVVFNSTGN